MEIFFAGVNRRRLNEGYPIFSEDPCIASSFLDGLLRTENGSADHDKRSLAKNCELFCDPQHQLFFSKQQITINSSDSSEDAAMFLFENIHAEHANQLFRNAKLTHMKLYLLRTHYANNLLQSCLVFTAKPI